MNNIMKAYIYIFMFVLAPLATAKLDPSTSVMVKRGTAAVEEVEELDATRYEVRTVQQPVQQQPVVVKKVVKEVPVTTKVVKVSSDSAAAGTSNTSAAAGGADVETETIVVKKIPVQQQPVVVKKVVATPATKVIVKEALVEDTAVQLQEVNFKAVRFETPKTDVPLSQQLQIFLLGDPKEIEGFREQLHPLDTKNNKFELDVAPYWLNVSSKSPSWYRNYNYTSLGIAGDMRFWITPFFGIALGYQTSLGAQMTGNPAGTATAQVTNQVAIAGFRFRKYFGSYRKAPVMTYGIDYYGWGESTSGDNNERYGIKTQGILLSANATIPVTLAYSHLFRVTFLPRPSTSETSPTNSSSGNSPTVYDMGAGFGGLYQLDRYHQLFWRFDVNYETVSYKGQTSYPDPVTGNYISNVPVNNTTTMLYLGLQFGQ